MDEAIEALRRARTIAVVGLDNRQHRSAYRIAAYLQSRGYQIVPVPFQETAEEVLGQRAYPRVQDIPFKVDLVDVFVRSAQTDAVIDDAVVAGAGAVWLQSGIRNQAGLERARKSGLVVAQDRCTMVEHRRHIAAASGP